MNTWPQLYVEVDCLYRLNLFYGKIVYNNNMNQNICMFLCR